MKDQHDLLKQLNNLPNEAKAPDRWQDIQRHVEAEQASEQAQERKRQPWWAVAVAASALLIAVIAPKFLGESEHIDSQQLVANNNQQTAVENQGQEPAINPAYLLTIDSLQQANAYYYAKLGHQVSADKVQLSPSTWSSLSSLRQSQQQYRAALAQKPQDPQIQERLFWLYQKERDLLRQFVV